MEEQSQVEAIQVHHYRLLLPRGSVIISCELQIAVLVEAFLLSPGGNVVENVDLRGYLAVVGDEFYFADVGHSVELEGDFLGVGAEATGLPALRAGEEKGTDGVLPLLAAAGNDLEFQLPAHCNRP